MVRWFEIGKKVEVGSFEKALEDILLQKSISQFHNKQIVNVSSVFSHCFRKNVLCVVLGVDKTEDSSIARGMAFEIGKYIHSIFQHKILPEFKIIGRWINCNKEEQVGSVPSNHSVCNSFCWRYKELELSKDLGYGWRLVGHPDGIVYFQGKWFIVELKTMDGGLFKNLNDVLLEHFVQIQMYLYLVRDQFPEVVTAKCVYINKDYNKLFKCESCNKTTYFKSDLFKVFDIEYDNQCVEQILQGLKTIEQLYKKVVPDRICKDLNDGFKRKCPVVSQCFNDFIVKEIIIDDKVITKVEEGI